MKRFFSRFEDYMTAAAFAEEGEFEMAERIVREQDRPGRTDRPVVQTRPAQRKVLRAE
ncbi:MAG TPA: hypothetical protein VN260_09985 [Dissulfurispiraceae bacterium]|nr:hypothetical protein [Dissulfurispiraceae bacterium]